MTYTGKPNKIPTQQVHLCPYTAGKQLICPYKGDNCMLQDIEFLKKLEPYLFLPRLSTYVLEPLQKIKNVQDKKKIAYLSEIFHLLPQSTQWIYKSLRFFYAFFRTDGTAQLWMSARLCREIRMIRSKFNSRMRDRE